MKVKLIAVTKPTALNIHNQQNLIEYAGRKCTKTTEKVNTTSTHFIENRIKQGHTSILEHISFTFEIDGISRSCLAQLTRHRIGFSYSVESMRYVKMNGAEFVLPPSIEKNKVAKTLFNMAVNRSNYIYKILLGLGVKAEDARFILPLATKTNLVLTANLRALLHFFELRTHKSAQWEIRELAEKLKEIVQDYCPDTV